MHEALEPQMPSFRMRSLITGDKPSRRVMSMVGIMRIVCLTILLSSWVVRAQDSMTGPVAHREASDEDQALIRRQKKRLLKDKTEGKTTAGQKLVREAETRNLETYTRIWTSPNYGHSSEGEGEGKSSESKTNATDIDSSSLAHRYGSKSKGKGKSSKSKSNARGNGSSSWANRWRFWDSSRNDKQDTRGRMGRVGSNPGIVPNPSGSGLIFKRPYLVGANGTPAPDSSKEGPTVAPAVPNSSPVSAPVAPVNAPVAAPIAAPVAAPVAQTTAPVPDTVESPSAPLASFAPAGAPVPEGRAPSAPFAPAATPVPDSPSPNVAVTEAPVVNIPAETPAPTVETTEAPVINIPTETPAPVIDAPTAPVVTEDSPSAPFAPSAPSAPSASSAPVGEQ